MANLNSVYDSFRAEPDDDNNRNLLAAEVTRYSVTVCRRRMISLADAEEIAQDTALNINQKISQYNPARSSFRTWVHRCVLDQVCIHRRKGEAHAKTATSMTPSPTQKARIDHTLIQQIRLVAGDNAQLVDAVLATGDISAAARKLGITVLAAQKRLKRIGAKINLGEWSKPTLQMP
jgi:DNA-directed RNA polymerase specialized sigma24 family protein